MKIVAEAPEVLQAMRRNLKIRFTMARSLGEEVPIGSLDENEIFFG